MPESLLTASEVAKLLRLNVETVYTLIATKGLPAAKIGSQWRFEESRVRAWVEAWMREPPRSLLWISDDRGQFLGHGLRARVRKTRPGSWRWMPCCIAMLALEPKA
jgi:excisionase family DNA binding protein